MGNKTPKKETKEKQNSVLESIQTYNAMSLGSVIGGSEIAINDNLSENSMKIKQYLKLVYKSNFVSLTFVILNT